MITNSSLTVYHKGFDSTTKNETWTRKVYKNVWWFGSHGSGINKGYDNANDVDIRISYNENPNIEDFAIGDILVQGIINQDIETQQDLDYDIYDIYNITSITNNNFGGRPHIHIGGK